MSILSGGRRRLAAATLAAFLSLSAPASAVDPDRWAPSAGIEDGAEEGAPVAAQVELDPKGKAAPGGPAIEIKAPSAVLIEAQSGQVLFEKNPHERRNPASVTKIMTLIIAFDAIRAGKAQMEDKITFSHEAAKQIGTIIFADEGETFTLAELLKSIAVGSANDASVAVAEHIGGSHESFVELMNRKAQELGMRDTQFRNSTGLSAEGHFTSAFDIAVMSRYAALHYPELIRLTGIYGDDLQVPWRRNGPIFRLWNNNKLLTWYKGADGLKTGWTEAAGYCLAATATKEGVRMISVIMGADSWKDRNAEAAKLLDYGFANYTAVALAPRTQAFGQVQVARGTVPRVEAVPERDFAVSVLKGKQKEVKTEIRMKGARVDAPVKQGQVLGEMVATLDGHEVGKVNLVASQAVDRASLFGTMVYYLGRAFEFR